MLTTVNELKEQTKADVGIYHHVDGCYTVIGPVPEGVEIGVRAYNTSGGSLLLRAVAKADAPSVVYNLKYATVDAVLLEMPDAEEKVQKKTTRKAKKVEQEIPDVDDTDVDSMT